MKIQVVIEYCPMYSLFTEKTDLRYKTPIELNVSEEKAKKWIETMENLDKIQREISEEINK